jgi:hypothetical protein
MRGLGQAGCGDDDELKASQLESAPWHDYTFVKRKDVIVEARYKLRGRRQNSGAPNGTLLWTKPLADVCVPVS